MTFSCQIYDTTILLTQTSSLALSISGQVCHPTLLSSVGILMIPCPEPVLSIMRLSPGSGLCLSRPSEGYSYSIPRRAMQENYHLRLRVPLKIPEALPEQATTSALHRQPKRVCAIHVMIAPPITNLGLDSTMQLARHSAMFPYTKYISRPFNVYPSSQLCQDFRPVDEGKRFPFAL